MKTELVFMTPQFAAELLKKNTSNRPLRAKTIDYIANSILNREWKITHQGIAISKDDVLLDGQHRLAGIVKANIAVNILMSTDVENDTFTVIDSGLPRTLSDLTHIDRKEVEVVSFFIKALLGNNRAKISSQRIIDVHAKTHEFIRKIGSGTNAKFFSSAPFRAASAIHLMAGRDEHTVQSIYRDLVLSNTNSEFPIVHAALKMALKSGFVVKGGSEYQKEQFILAMRILNPKNKNINAIISKSWRRLEELDEARKILLKHIES